MGFLQKNNIRWGVSPRMLLLLGFMSIQSGVYAYGVERQDVVSIEVVEEIDDEMVPVEGEKEVETRTTREVRDADWQNITKGETFDEDHQKREIEEVEEEYREESVSTDSFFDSDMFKNLSIALILVVIGIIIYLVVKDHRFNVKLDEDISFSIAEAEKNIEESDLEALLAKAIDKQAYKQALRIHYLIIIKSLNQKGLIEYKNNKTNYTYLLEMQSNGLHDAFRNITRIYEYHWYGDHDVDHDRYARISSGLTKFNHKISDNP